MGIQYNSTPIGDIRAVQINGESGIGSSHLRFVLGWTLFVKREDVYTVFGTSIWVSVVPEGGGDPAMLGQAVPEAAWCEESGEGQPFERPLMYRLIMPNPQLLALEQRRQGRGLVFTLDVRGNSQGPYGIRGFADTLKVPVNVSDWNRVLKEAGAADVILVGVHLPMMAMDSPVRAAIDLVRSAHEHLVFGHYSVAVAECRRAIESLWTAANLSNAAKAARKLMSTQDERMSMTKRDRELALGAALINFSNNAHHVGPNAEPEIFSRTDAALAVAVAASLVSSLAVSPDFGQSNDSAEGTPLESAAVKPKAPAPKAVADLTLSEKVGKVRQFLRSNLKTRPATLKKLRSALDSAFAKKLSAPQLDELMAELIKRKVITETAGKLVYADAKPSQ